MKKYIPSTILIVCYLLIIGCNAEKPLSENANKSQSPNQEILDLQTPPHDFSQPTTNGSEITQEYAIGQNQENLQLLFQSTMDCDEPCFGGIVPQETTKDESIEILKNIGVYEGLTLPVGNAPISFNHTFTNNFDFFYYSSFNNGVVQNIFITFTPETQTMGLPRTWLAFSPETVIKQYGSPSDIEIIADLDGPHAIFSLILYYSNLNFIAEYTDFDDFKITPEGIELCPLINQQQDVRIWMGENLEYPPLAGIPLEEATSLSIPDFEKLMMGKPEEACFSLSGDKFIIH